MIVVGLVACGRQAPVFAPGNLTVTSTPDSAAIFIDGQDTGAFTPHLFADLDANLYNVRVQLADHISTPDHISVDLAPLDDLTLAFALSQTGLQVTSNPAGAAIFIDGTDTGEITPATIGGLSAGVVDVSLTLPTYLVSPASLPVTISEGSVASVPDSAFSIVPQRTVVLEGFANVDCIPCPQLTANLVAMADKPGFGPDRVLYLEYSVSWPNFTDPLYLYNPSENTDRFTDYLVLAAPAVYEDGHQLGDALNANAMEAAALLALQTDPGFAIALNADFTNPTVPVTVTLDPRADRDLAGYSLYVALYEKVVDFNARGISPGANNQVVFHHVFRDRVDTPPPLGVLTAGIPDVHQVNLTRGDWALDNLVVVAFVQHDTNHAIIQAGSFGETATAGGTP